MEDPSSKRIAVIGVTCSGKSTLADRLSRSLGLARIELDALHWKPGWVGSDREEFRAKVDAATRGQRWVADGNYASVRDLVWERADLIVWLDYPLGLVLARWARRTWRRWRAKELLWGTNRESFCMELTIWSKRSLIHWLFRSYFRHRREYPALLSDPARSRAAWRRFRHPREVEAWLQSSGKP
jgi:adenylate kinase family enzyme